MRWTVWVLKVNLKWVDSFFFFFDKLLQYQRDIWCILKINRFVVTWNQPSFSRQNSPEVIVRIPELGRLRGSIGTTTWTNREFFQFLGVQYAEAPSGARRFKVKFLVFLEWTFFQWISTKSCFFWCISTKMWFLVDF